MSWFRPRGLIELRPHHSVFFVNHSREEVALWICFNREWYLFAVISSRRVHFPIPESSGVQVEWRILTARATLHLNSTYEVELNSRLEGMHRIAGACTLAKDSPMHARNDGTAHGNHRF